MNVDFKEFFLKRRSTLLSFLAIGLFLFSWVNFIFTPFTGDIRVFLASANQSNFISKDLIVGAFKAWELKSVFSRTLMYFIYKIACLFTTFGTYPFEVTCKLIYSFIIIACSYLAMFFLFGTDKKKLLLSFLVTSTFFFTVHNTCHMQVEMTTAMIVLLAYSLYINAIKTDKKTIAKLLCSGALIGSTFFYKSILLVLSVSVVAAVSLYLLDKQQKYSIKRLMVVVSGSIIMLTVTFLLIILINPSEIRDMINASYFQKSVFGYDVKLKPLLEYVSTMSLDRFRFIPVVYAGYLAFLFNLILTLLNNEKHKRKRIILHIIMLIMPLLFVTISYKFFVYHYAAFIFPGIIEVYYAVISCKFLRKKEWNINYAAIGLYASVLFFIFWYVVHFSVLSPSFRNYFKENLQTYKTDERILSEIDFDRNETVLFLDDGRGAYYLGNPSYIKYYFPLPLQRLPENSELSCHKDCYDAVMNYSGKYISVYEGWFFENNKYQEIKEHIYNEYEPVTPYYVFTSPFAMDYNPDGIVLTFTLFQKKSTIEKN